MVDKIIIDGVDVKKCEKQFANGCDVEDGCYEPCEGKFCLYKQLARKKKTIEALKKALLLKENNRYIQASFLQCKIEDYAELEQRHNDAYKQFQALKAQYDAVVERNRHLQEELKCERGIKPTSAKAAKYYKALEEIKEVATDLRIRTDYHSPDEVNADIDKILQKCEVINE